MPTPIDPKRLPGLKAALATFGADDKLPHQQLAEIYGVTSARLTTLIKHRFENFPEPERHGDKTNWFLARPALESMIAYLQKSGKSKHQEAARAASIMGNATAAAAAAEPDEPEPPPMGAAELDRLASASTKIWRLALEQKKYIKSIDVAHWARAQNELVKREVQQIPHAIDPNGELPPLHRARLEATCRELLVQMDEKLAVLLSTTDQGTEEDADEGTGRSSAVAA